MSGRKAAILGRIREALREPAPRPGHHGEGALHHGAPPADFGHWLPPVDENLDAQIEAFSKNSLELKTEFHVLASREELGARFAQMAREEGWASLATHAGPLIDLAISKIELPTLKTDSGYGKVALAQCAAGVTECDALIAQTGSVLITGRSAGGRALSVLPPHHIVVATREQLLPDLPAAFALLRAHYADDWPSFISFITGPSRTGDIERILVLGAHGPKRLTIFLC